MFLKSQDKPKLPAGGFNMSHDNGPVLVFLLYLVINWEQLMKCSLEHRIWGSRSVRFHPRRSRVHFHDPTEGMQEIESRWLTIMAWIRAKVPRLLRS